MIKFLVADTYYPQYLSYYYSQHRPESDILKSLFGTSDFYSQAITGWGHQAKTIVINDWLRQSRWAAKYLRGYYSLFTRWGLLARPELANLRRNLETDIFLQQIREYRPNIIYFLDITHFPPEVLTQLKHQGYLLLGQIASALPNKEYFQPFDLIISSLPNILNRVKRMGVRTYYQPLAFAPQVLPRLKPGGDHYQISHIGGYGAIHQERNRVLSYAAARLSIDFWGYSVSSLPQACPIRNTYHGEAWGKNMYQILADSRITLTKHIRLVAGPYANNMTLYEATGCGTLLLTDAKVNLHHLFEPEKELVTYRNSSELVEKARYYLKHESQRQRIASAGQQRTLRYHTYPQRMKQLIKYLTLEFKL